VVIVFAIFATCPSDDRRLAGDRLGGAPVVAVLINGVDQARGETTTALQRGDLGFARLFGLNPRMVLAGAAGCEPLAQHPFMAFRPCSSLGQVLSLMVDAVAAHPRGHTSRIETHRLLQLTTPALRHPTMGIGNEHGHHHLNLAKPAHTGPASTSAGSLPHDYDISGATTLAQPSG
jgi:hypothetical protein